MSAASDRHHAEWLGLIDVSGPFLTLPVLGDEFPEGLDGVDPETRRRLRTAHGEWAAENQKRRPDRALHRAWIDFVLGEALGWRESSLREGQELPPGVTVRLPEQGVTLRPDLALVDRPGADVEAAAPARVLVSIHPPGQELDRAVSAKEWGTPQDRMAELLRGSGVRLGLVTNGEQWTLVDAPRGETAAFVTWEAERWLDEDITLRAFVSLLQARRLFGVADGHTLEAMLARSKQDQADVTTQLGNQVRHAVELLVRAIDRADRDRRGELLAGVPDATLYEGAIAVMMRLVFLLFAEDQKPPLIGGSLHYQEGYAVSPMRDQLRASTKGNEDILERRHDAWARLLATFRLVHAGSEHEAMRFQPYGGDLFDPDAYPFLEGRAAKSTWRDTPANPPAVDNRTVLHLLDSIQSLRLKSAGSGQVEAQRISFRGLDVEQIGHVYENLLGHTAARADGPVLALAGKDEPEIALDVLEARRAEGEEKLAAFLAEETGRSAAAVRKALAARLDAQADRTLLEACGNDAALHNRALPFAALIRNDDAGRPLVIPAGGRYVTAGSDRRSLGAHYTPRSLTEPIVRYALEPLVYEGPAEGLPREEWTLRDPLALLGLTVCDPAMGSGAFLVQACRYLSERLVEAWDAIEAKAGGAVRITPEGRPSTGDSGEEMLPQDRDERLAVARRIVADRCLYGVDKNRLATEMAKLSLWLVTLQKGRPFTFLDHALRTGDSLLGLSDLEQLRQWTLTPAAGGKARQTTWFTAQIDRAIAEAAEERRRIAGTDVRDVRDAKDKADMLRRATQLTSVLRLGADLLVAAALHPEKKRRAELRDEFLHRYSLVLDGLRMARAGEVTAAGAAPVDEELRALRTEARRLLDGRRPFHWPLEFPEVMGQWEGKGFAALVGNPPFLGGQKITGSLGITYREYLVDMIAGGARGSADLVAYFFLRAGGLTSRNGGLGMLATNTVAQGDTREVGLDQLVANGWTIPRAERSVPWPGSAGLEVAHLWLRRGSWSGGHALNGAPVSGITAMLAETGRMEGKPYRLVRNAGVGFQGTVVLGLGFVLDPSKAQELIAKDGKNREVLVPYLNGEDLNSRPDRSPSRWVINFRDWPLDRAEDFPDCLRIVIEKVKPERDLNPRSARRERWWQFAERAPALYTAISTSRHVVASCRVTKHLIHALTHKDQVFDVSLNVMALDDLAEFVVMLSPVYETWVRAWGSSLETRLRYTLTDCYETFPLPNLSGLSGDLGNRFDQTICNAMLTRNTGATSLWNLIHDSRVNDSDVTSLRDLLSEINDSVCRQFGWSDLDSDLMFLDTELGQRFTIGSSMQKEIVQRLHEINYQRHAEEVAAGLVDETGRPLRTKAGGRAGAKRRGSAAQASMSGLV